MFFINLPFLIVLLEIDRTPTMYFLLGVLFGDIILILYNIYLKDHDFVKKYISKNIYF